MAVSQIYLQGGPCDGRTVSADKIVGGLVAYIPCGGGYYTADDGKTRPNGDLIFAYAGTTKPGPPGGNLPRGHKGFNDFEHALARHLPTHLRRARAVRLHVLRKMGAPRNLGG